MMIKFIPLPVLAIGYVVSMGAFAGYLGLLEFPAAAITTILLVSGLWYMIFRHPCFQHLWGLQLFRRGFMTVSVLRVPLSYFDIFILFYFTQKLPLFGSFFVAIDSGKIQHNFFEELGFCLFHALVIHVLYVIPLAVIAVIAHRQHSKTNA